MTSELRGIVLAGGTGSRLFPLTKVTNKHLLPVGRVPMIFHPIRRLIETGIHEIMVVTGTEHLGDVVGLLGSGREMGAEFTYRVQDEAGGIAQALGLCRGFAQGQPVAVILGDNIFNGPVTGPVQDFLAQGSGARLVLAPVPDPHRFGVATFGPEPARELLEIVEKPTTPPSNYAVTGLYFYDARVFHIVSELAPSRRGELEITDVNNTYLSWGELHYDIWETGWSDAGTFDSLRRANEMVAGQEGD
jgi:glucose-1-phosphate thymidylyltransferase